MQNEFQVQGNTSGNEARNLCTEHGTERDCRYWDEGLLYEGAERELGNEFKVLKTREYIWELDIRQ